MNRVLNILVACGSGIATSTVAQEAVKKIIADAGIKAKIFKSTMTEIPSKQENMDIIMVTTNYRQPLDKPLIKVFGLISGIGEEGIKKEIVETCKNILGEE